MADTSHLEGLFGASPSVAPILPPRQAATGEVIDDATKPYIIDRYGVPHLRPTVVGNRFGYHAASAPVSAPELPRPVSDFLTKASNVLESPLTLIGAAEMDAAAHRLGQPPNLGHHDTSLAHAINEMAQGQFGEAASNYSTTSLGANRERAKLGDPGAQFLEHHPTGLAGLAFLEELFNPSNKVLAGGTSLLGKAVRGAARTVGRAAPSMNRFEDIRNAAEESASQRAEAEAAAAQRKAQADAIRKQSAATKAQAARDARWKAKQAAARGPALNQRPAPGPALMPARPLVRPVEPTVTRLAGDQPLVLQPGVEGTKPIPLLPIRPALPKPAPEGPALPPFATAAQLQALPSSQNLALGPGVLTPEELAAQSRTTARLRLRTAGQVRRATRTPIAPPRAMPMPGEVPPLPPVTPALGAGVPPRGGPFTALPPQPKVEPLNFQPAIEGQEPQAIPPGERGDPNMAAPKATLAIPDSSSMEPVGEVVPNKPLPAKAPPPPDIADRAEREFRKMAETQSARSAAAEATHDLYKGLTRAQQIQMYDAIEGTEPTPPEWAQRVAKYRAFQRRISNQLLDNEIADVGELWNEDTFHPRSGATLNPDIEFSEQAAQGEVPVGTRGIRKGTLRQRRVYATRREMEEAGEMMNPEWSPAQTLEKSVTSRLQSIALEKGMRELKRLGLITEPGAPTPPGWVTLAQEPDVARFGSPTIAKGASFHPAVAKGIRDITASALNPEKLLSSPLHKLTRPLAAANRAVSRLEVSNPFFHPAANVGPNQIATIIAHAPNAAAALQEYLKALVSVGKVKNPIEYVKKLVSGEGLDDVHDAGAAFPYASDIDAHLMTRPWSDLSLQEKAARVYNLIGRGVENITAKPLYKNIEPRMARAAYRGLQKGGVAEPKAALLTRQTVGEGENLGAVERDAAQMMQFPAWRKAVLRLWPQLLAHFPALYNSPHRAVEAYNLSRGVPTPASDSTALIPGIAFGKDAQGNPQTLNLPSPANIPLQLLDILGTPLAGNYGELPSRTTKLGLTLLNPLLNTGIRSAMTEVAKSGEPGSGLGGFRIIDKASPQAQTPVGSLLGALGQSESRYAPLRPGGMVRTNLSPDTQMTVNIIESRYRKLIDRLRMASSDAQKTGDRATAKEYTSLADDLYNEMEDQVKAVSASAAPTSSTPTGAKDLEHLF